MLINRKSNPSKRGYFTKVNNEVIIHPETENEYNVTNNFDECSFCQNDVSSCRGNKTGMYCKGFKIVENFVYRR